MTKIFRDRIRRGFDPTIENPNQKAAPQTKIQNGRGFRSSLSC